MLDRILCWLGYHRKWGTVYSGRLSHYKCKSCGKIYSGWGREPKGYSFEKIDVSGE